MDSNLKHTHIWIHKVKWANGLYGTCPKRTLHVHDLLDQIVVLCKQCNRVYPKSKKTIALDNFVERNKSLLKRPEKLFNKYGR